MQTITLIIADESKGLNPSQLADFLYLFRAANLALSRIVPERMHNAFERPTSAQLASFRSRLGHFSPKELDSFFDPCKTPDAFEICKISRQSPLEIVLGGCAFLLVVGVFVSGGKIAISWSGIKGMIKAELPPLGEGIKCLRDALGLSKTLQAGFGIRSIVIRLSREELSALLQESKGQGGFQDLLLRLQYRVNKQTRELELSQHDLERIHRYKAKPNKGGFQARFKRIFGRHFPDE